MKVLVTGASGFVGQAVVDRLLSEEETEVCAAVRTVVASSAVKCETHVVGSIDGSTDWNRAIEGVDAVVHLAARVHQMQDHASDPDAAYRAVNLDGTLNLARQSGAAGVRRFIYLSSVKVHGVSGHFTEASEPAPIDPYARSKWLAEQGLADVARTTGLETVIVRPPLVYGPGVKANFRALVGAVRRGIPLPLSRVRNRRSLVGLDNLVDFIRCCIERPAAAHETFLVSDAHDLSTPDLIRSIAKAMGRSPRLFPVPEAALRLGATLVGRKAAFDRLLGSLTVGTEKATTLLDWHPPYSVEEQLRRAVAAA